MDGSKCSLIEPLLRQLGRKAANHLCCVQFEEMLNRFVEPDQADLMAMEASAEEQLLAMTRAMFDRLDTDGDGAISKAELKAGLASDKEIQKIFAGENEHMALRRLDLDGDGEISWDEVSFATEPARWCMVNTASCPCLMRIAIQILVAQFSEAIAG